MKAHSISDWRYFCVFVCSDRKRYVKFLSWIDPTNQDFNSKVVSTHLWNTPLNLYQQAVFRDSFHSCLRGLPNGCAISGCVASFLGSISRPQGPSPPARFCIASTTARPFASHLAPRQPLHSARHSATKDCAAWDALPQKHLSEYIYLEYWYMNISAKKIYTYHVFKSHRIHGTGLFTYIYHKNQLNVGKYTIHGSSGNNFFGVILQLRMTVQYFPLESVV